MTGMLKKKHYTCVHIGNGRFIVTWLEYTYLEMRGSSVRGGK